MHEERPFVLIDDARPNVGAGANHLLFADPCEILSCTDPADLDTVFTRIEGALAQGKYVAGYMAYELGYALEPKLHPLLKEDGAAPLIWMGVFEAPTGVTDETFQDWAAQPHNVGAMQTPLRREEYLQQVERIRTHIRDGDVYQINHTFLQHFAFSGSPLSLYAKLRARQRAQYGALVHDGRAHILSLSPELFFATDSGVIRTRPMKGTAPRAANPEQDRNTQAWLRDDEKSRAENLMIVDLLRNDLSRLSLVGSVNVTDLFSIETYPTVHQMTSGIEARLRPGTRFSDIAKALFPCGSVTGAPKIKAMEIIHALEAAPRGVYTGAVGFMAPDGQACFNVAIRTVRIHGGTGTLGIGSGIVYDSDPKSEWDECHLKARFLTDTAEPFSLLETLMWNPDDGFALLERHLKRLEDSAAYFGYPFDRAGTERALTDAIPAGTSSKLRIRLLLDQGGRLDVQAAPLTPIGQDGVLRYAFAPEPLDTNTPFVYHKTTNRAFYDDVRTHTARNGTCEEVVFTNANGEVTEGSFTNVFVERNGILLTPPRACGVLNGTLREELIAQGYAREALLYPQDLINADTIWLGNSVRGLMRAIPATVAKV